MKVAICIPCYGDTKSKFTHSLSQMIIYSLGADLRRDGEKVDLDLDVFMVSSSMLTESRHRLVAEAIAWEADYMLCLDADHVFPPDTLLQLLSHNLPVVGCNYARRVTPTAPSAARETTDDDDNGLLYTTEEKAKAALVEECAHLGFGVLLIDCRVFDHLQAHAEEHGDGNFLPLFQFVPTENKVGMIGEDVFFFKKLKEAGIVPFCDHGLSWHVGHISEIILTNAHAEVQQGRWAERQKKKADKFKRRIAELEQAADEGELAA